LREIKEGGYFGEEALLQDAPVKYTVKLSSVIYQKILFDFKKHFKQIRTKEKWPSCQKLVSKGFWDLWRL
jgi:hypothetical protein